MKKLSERSSRALISTAITVGVIVAVLLFNVLVSVIFTNNRWYLDVSPETKYAVYSSGISSTGTVGTKKENKYARFYTLTDETVAYLGEILDAVNEKEGKPVPVDILFCADPDILERSDMMRMVYYTAKNLEKTFPDNIRVSTVDVLKNPSAVDIYRANSYSNIYQSNVIISSGTEFRVRPLNSFFTFSSNATEPWAYSGEKAFIQQILCVTRAESPIACITTNHSEPFADLDLEKLDEWTEYNSFVYSLENAGYEVRFLNLETEPIPENCRLIVTYDPMTDFKSAFGDGVAESETVKLDKFLDKAYTFMVFVDADTPKLENLETYLEKWGLAFDRGTTPGGDSGNYAVNQNISLGNGGYTFQGVFAQVGLGASIVTDMLDNGSAPTVAFSNVMPIRYTFEEKYVAANAEEGTPAFSYGEDYKNTHQRAIYDVFTSIKNANAYLKVNGEYTETAKSGKFRLATISMEDRIVSEGQSYTTVHDISYVMAFGSTEFCTNRYLEGNTYGNNDVLLASFRSLGHEVEPVGIAFVSLYDEEIDAEAATEQDVRTATVTLVAMPIVICLGACAVVSVRRKFKY